MNSAKKSILIYFDNFPMVTALSPEQRGWLLTVLLDYGDRLSRDQETTLEEVMGQYPLAPDTRLVCGFMGANIRRDTQRWLSRQRSAAGPNRPRRGLSPGPAPAPAPEAEQKIREDIERTRRILEQFKGEDSL